MDSFKLLGSSNKKIKATYSVRDRQWVGDGFYVHGLLRPSDEINKFISPFLLVDYASPKEFSKTDQRRGVGEHPHRGFETVTLAYQGEIEHRDSSGGGGIIKEGGVQWMTAGKGVVHDEFHSPQFSQKGGLFEMVQLWVNLPKEHKMTPAKYQGFDSKKIPKVEIGEGIELRVIAGTYKDVVGPATTFSPVQMYDLKSKNGGSVHLPFIEGSNTILLIMSGRIEMQQKQQYHEQSLLVFEQSGADVSFVASGNFKALVLNGMPLDEPVVAHGPFVMNTRAEISQAIKDYQNGTMGTLKK